MRYPVLLHEPQSTSVIFTIHMLSWELLQTTFDIRILFLQHVFKRYGAVPQSTHLAGGQPVVGSFCKLPFSLRIDAFVIKYQD
jgi:hypothetical protein